MTLATPGSPSPETSSPDPYAVTDFDADVLEASREVPVLVDFWAPWCGPCRTLGPALESLAEEAAQGSDAPRWRLVKVNTDKHPHLMQRYGVRGIPAVKLFSDGHVIAEFTGALPEYVLRQWLDEHLPTPARKQFDEAMTLLDDGNRSAARDRLRMVIESGDTGSFIAEARQHLARLLVFAAPGDATALIEGRHTTEAESVRTVAEALQRDLEALPEGTVRAPYAEALTALREDRLDAALGTLIEVIQTDRAYDDDGARRLTVALFHILGEDDPVVRKHRPVFNRSLY